MRSTALAGATTRCLGRQALDLSRSRPVAATAAVIATLAAPLLLWRAGDEVGRALDPVLVDPRVARSFALGLLVAALAAGATLGGALEEGARRLDPLVRAAPPGDCAEFACLVVLPAALTALAATPLLLALLLPMAAASTGGRAAGSGLFVGLLSAATTGAAVSALGRRVRATGAREAWAGVGIGLGWVLGSGGHDPLLGPVGLGVAALSGRRGPGAALALGLLSCVVGVLVWAAAGARRDRAAPRSSTSFRRLPRGTDAATAAAALRLLFRRNDLRQAVVSGLTLAWIVEASALAMNLEARSAVGLGSGVAALGAVAVPLAAPGLRASAQWLWATVPARPVRGALAWSLPTMLVPSVAAGLAVAPFVFVDLPTASALAGVGGLALVAGAAGLVAGTLIPWGPGPGQQVAAFAVLAAVATVLASTAAAIGGRVVAAGVPEALVAAFLAAGVVATAAAAVAAGSREW
jgi:hypothetical protein